MAIQKPGQHTIQKCNIAKQQNQLSLWNIVVMLFYLLSLLMHVYFIIPFCSLNDFVLLNCVRMDSWLMTASTKPHYTCVMQTGQCHIRSRTPKGLLGDLIYMNDITWLLCIDVVCVVVRVNLETKVELNLDTRSEKPVSAGDNSPDVEITETDCTVID